MNGSTHFHKNKLCVILASYKSYERADSVLDDMFSEGEISWSEFAGIVKIKGKFCILSFAE